MHERSSFSVSPRHEGGFRFDAPQLFPATDETFQQNKGFNYLVKCFETTSRGGILVRIFEMVLDLKEGLKRLDDFLRHFLWQIMTTGQNVTFHGAVGYPPPGIQHVIRPQHPVGIAPKD